MEKKNKLLRVLFFVLIFSFILPLASSQVIISQQPQQIYNLGEVISTPVVIKTISGISGFFNMDLICGGSQTNFFRDGVQLASGEEKRIESSLVLINEVIGELKGNCRIKAYIGNDYVLTEEFKISDKLILNTELSIKEFNPGETFFVEGQVNKETGNSANGFIEATILKEGEIFLNQSETVNNGIFSFNINLPQNMPARSYILRLKAYEVDNSGKITNQGIFDQGISIPQIPTSLEIFFESKEVKPGSNLRVKAILHDQTGEKIISDVKLSIKDRNNKIVKETMVQTDEFFDFWIAKNELPESWSVIASSEEFIKESNFKIVENEEISIEIIGRIMIITNVGNVPYEKKSVINIGNETLTLDIILGIGKSQKYMLSAPDGNYTLEIVSGDYNELMNIALTGKVIDIQEISGTPLILQHSLIWIFTTFLLAFVVFIMIKKGYQRTFIGYIKSRVKKERGKKGDKKVKEKPNEKVNSYEGNLINSKNPAEISLSIKGEKQNVNIVAINIKNIKENQLKDGNAKETLQKIVDFSEEHKVITYESHNTIFLIISPIKTRTFSNENLALEIAQKAKEIILQHNKLFKQRISFGISLTYGAIVAKLEKGVFKFMSLGNLMTSTKKISSLAQEDILISEKMNERIRSRVKTEKQEKDNLEYYTIKEIKKDSEEYKRFIKKFLEREKKDKG
ncbi:hypothetical protein K0A97_00660 [Patescibacteria group bacterium]|nr:hypothetical protein [Patescibacteria group bacterium]